MRDVESREVLGDKDRGPSLIAYRLPTGHYKMRIVPASSRRAWMDATTDKFANRCLPLKIANQAGWSILNDRAFRVTWDGGTERTSGRVEPLDEADEMPLAASSHFGHGILTFHIPFLFRTPPGYNMLARGPANLPKDGISPLEGIIETDWSIASFTMNWRMTRTDHPVLFEEGEPICMVLPQWRGELEEFVPEVRELNDDLELAYDYWKWSESRWRFMTEDEKRRVSEGKKIASPQHYVRGTSPTGIGSEEHQTKLRLGRFEGAE